VRERVLKRERAREREREKERESERARERENKLNTDEGDEITYEYLVVAMGLKLHYNKVIR
jgi:hypothetical protein